MGVPVIDIVMDIFEILFWIIVFVAVIFGLCSLVSGDVDVPISERDLYVLRLDSDDIDWCYEFSNSPEFDVWSDFGPYVYRFSVTELKDYLGRVVRDNDEIPDSIVISVRSSGIKYPSKYEKYFDAMAVREEAEENEREAAAIVEMYIGDLAEKIAMSYNAKCHHGGLPFISNGVNADYSISVADDWWFNLSRRGFDLYVERAQDLVIRSMSKDTDTDLFCTCGSYDSSSAGMSSTYYWENKERVDKYNEEKRVEAKRGCAVHGSGSMEAAIDARYNRDVVWPIRGIRVKREHY